MKKIILLAFALITSLTLIAKPIHAIEYNDIDDIIIPVIDYFPHGVGSQGDANSTPSVPNVINTLNTNAYTGRLLYIQSYNRPVNYSFTFDNDLITIEQVTSVQLIFDWYVTVGARRIYIKAYNGSGTLVYDEYYGYNLINIQPTVYDINNYNYQTGYQEGLNAGYNDGYNVGYNESKNLFGIYYNDIWYSATAWGDLRYDLGYNDGLSSEIDWWSWSTTFFLMPFRVLNIEILPGVRIGYFALFSLLIGVVGWFFFIVGKGGGRKK